MEAVDTVDDTPAVEGSIKMPKATKGARYYYRNREQILERIRKKRLEDPEYQAKQKEKEEKKRLKEEEKQKKKEEAQFLKETMKKEKVRQKAQKLGVEIPLEFPPV